MQEWSPLSSKKVKEMAANFQRQFLAMVFMAVLAGLVTANQGYQLQHYGVLPDSGPDVEVCIIGFRLKFVQLQPFLLPSQHPHKILTIFLTQITV